MTIIEFATRLVVAVLLGTVIGLERQYRQRMAGLRTNALVATGTCLFVTITPLVGGGALNATQIPAYVVSGIGFLAGGVIFKERLSVSGLNTAATIWCTAAIGALVGIGAIWYAVIGAAGILFANVVLRPIAQTINRQSAEDTEIVSSYEVRAVCRGDAEDRVRAAAIAAIKGNGIVLQAVYSADLDPAERVEIVLDASATGRADARMETIVQRIAVEPGVTAVSWKLVPTEDDEKTLLAEA
ncbi:MAG TPA: MgtC/SapB family protein [Candidatus Sulfotelmatobacter sp.]|nr:MgtC/SapB family protein [Candidatus Sulfotelmatobacter sp.]